MLLVAKIVVQMERHHKVDRYEECTCNVQQGLPADMEEVGPGIDYCDAPTFCFQSGKALQGQEGGTVAND